MDVVYKSLGALGSPSQFELAVATTVLAGLYVVWKVLYVKYGSLHKGKPLPPGPLFTVPIIGDGLGMGLSREHPAEFFYKRYKQYGQVFRLTLNGTTTYMITSMPHLRPILRDEGALLDVPFPGFKKLMGMDDNSPGASMMRNKPLHMAWRKLFGAALAPAQMSGLVPAVVEVMQRYLAQWEAKGQVYIFQESRAMGLDLGVDVITQLPLSDKVDRAWFKKQVEYFLDGLYCLPYALPGSTFSRALASRDKLLGVLGEELKETHAEFIRKWESSGRTPEGLLEQVLGRGGAEGDGTEVPAMDARAAERGRYNPELNVTLSQFFIYVAQGNMDPKDAGWPILHSFVAATDTTRYALFNVLVLVALSRRVQDRLFEEQQQVIKEYGPELSYKAACNMPYCDAVIKEAMRVLPANAGGLRVLTKDLEVGDYVIPKGAHVWYNTPLQHMIDPTLWDGDTSAPVAEHMDWRNHYESAFQPERWLAEGPKPLYLTFGTGAHTCLGMSFVYLEVRLLLSLLVRRHRLRLHYPDVLRRLDRMFPFISPAKGADLVYLEPREVPAPAA